MSEPTDLHEHDAEPSAIGVGMGGSCPVCRAPVDLGQEFCLECGSPIRFTPRQRRQQRGSARPGGVAPAGAPPAGGFPWIPFLVVLVLIGGGVAFALVDGDDRQTSGKGSADRTEDALPTIDNTVPEAVSETQTTTVPSCSDASVLDDTQPAIATPEDPATSGAPVGAVQDEQIPQLAEPGAPADGSVPGIEDPAVPSTDPNAPGSTPAVTVDQEGNLCPSDGTGTGTGDAPVDDGTVGVTPGTAPGDGTGEATAGTGSGDWPAGKAGWTVIVFGYNTEDRATQAAADLQEDGFSDGGVLFSSDFASLCPGFHVVFSGIFDTEQGAKARLGELTAKDYAGMYVREIRTSGPSPTNCQPAR